MRSNTRLTLLVAALVMGTQSSGQGSPEPLALLQRGIEKSELRVAETAPFRLRAEIHIKSGDSKPMTGTYELVWVSPSSWREDIKVAGATETRIGGMGKVWQFPSHSFEAQRIRNRARDLAFREALSVESKDQISPPSSRQIAGSEVACVKVKRQKFADQEFCFNLVSGVLRRSKAGSGWREYVDYKPAGSRLFPQRLTEGGTDVVRILDVEVNIQSDPRVFEPPAGTTPVSGCQYPRVPSALKSDDPEYPFPLAQPGVTGKTVVSGIVNTAGTLEDLRVISSGGSAADSSVLRTLPHWKFRPADCNGTPVSHMIEVEVNFSAH